jgi:hypothetical protein
MTPERRRELAEKWVGRIIVRANLPLLESAFLELEKEVLEEVATNYVACDKKVFEEGLATAIRAELKGEGNDLAAS